MHSGPSDYHMSQNMTVDELSRGQRKRVVRDEMREQIADLPLEAQRFAEAIRRARGDLPQSKLADLARRLLSSGANSVAKIVDLLLRESRDISMVEAEQVAEAILQDPLN